MDCNILVTLVIHLNIINFQSDSAIVLGAVKRTLSLSVQRRNSQLATKSFIGICTVTSQRYTSIIEEMRNHLAPLCLHIDHNLLHSSIKPTHTLGRMGIQVMGSQLDGAGELIFLPGWMELSLNKSDHIVFHHHFHRYQQRKVQIIILHRVRVLQQNRFSSCKWIMLVVQIFGLCQSEPRMSYRM